MDSLIKLPDFPSSSYSQYLSSFLDFTASSFHFHSVYSNPSDPATNRFLGDLYLSQGSNFLAFQQESIRLRQMSDVFNPVFEYFTDE